MAKWQKVAIEIPKRFGPTERMAIAQEVISFIIDRSRSGKDINGKSFAKYTKDYASKKGQSNVDLTLSAEMLDAMELLNHKSGALVIGYDKGNKELNGKVEGNQLGTYGKAKPIPGKARPFLGINEKDLKRILNKYPKSRDLSIEKAQEELAAASAADQLADGIEFKLDE